MINKESLKDEVEALLIFALAIVLLFFIGGCNGENHRKTSDQKLDALLNESIERLEKENSPESLNESIKKGRILE